MIPLAEEWVVDVRFVLDTQLLRMTRAILLPVRPADAVAHALTFARHIHPPSVLPTQIHTVIHLRTLTEFEAYEVPWPPVGDAEKLQAWEKTILDALDPAKIDVLAPPKKEPKTE